MGYTRSPQPGVSQPAAAQQVAQPPPPPRAAQTAGPPNHRPTAASTAAPQRWYAFIPFPVAFTITDSAGKAGAGTILVSVAIE